jgi:hypothetical protein
VSPTEFSPLQREGIFLFTSAKTGQNVETAFSSMAKSVTVREVEASVQKGQVSSADAKSIESLVEGIMLEFSSFFSNQDDAMSIIRLQFSKAGLDIKTPKKAELTKSVFYLCDFLRPYEKVPGEVERLKQRWLDTIAKL